MTHTQDNRTRVNAVRKRLSGPVIDADGHHVEIASVVHDFMMADSGLAVAARFEKAMKAVQSVGRLPVYWILPTKNTLDRATSHLPRLLYERLDEFGIDFSVLYPTMGLGFLPSPDDELRVGVSRAINSMLAALYGPFRDRLEPVAVIPMVTPDEAIAELDHAVVALGLKTICMSGVVRRASEPPEEGEIWLDTLGVDSLYDYDVVWARCLELGVAPTFHAVGSGWGTRASRSNYVFNHIGHFAAAQEGTCRSLTMAGVARRFPGLKFGFLEGGVSWACQLYMDMCGHFIKRNREAMINYDPAELDVGLLTKLFAAYGDVNLPASRDEILQFLKPTTSDQTLTVTEVDDFRMSGIRSLADIRQVFTSQYFFGCEADDPSVSWAYDTAALPGGARLQPMFASDIGHWDVTDMSAVLLEAWELVERDLVTIEAFEAFVGGNVHRLLTSMNPEFFANTCIPSDLQAG